MLNAFFRINAFFWIYSNLVVCLSHENSHTIDLNSWKYASSNAKAWEMLQEAQELRQGIGNVTKNVEAAIALYTSVVEMNDSFATGTALGILGKLYITGDAGVGIDVPHGLVLLKKSAEYGDPDGQHMLGILYAFGIPGLLPRSIPKSILFDYFASLGGNHRASMSLGFRHMFGHGVPKSCVAALRYYSIAAEKAVDEVEPIIKPSRSVARLNDYTERRDLDDEEHQLHYYSESARDGDTQVNIAQLMSSKNFGRTIDYVVARKLLLSAVGRGNSDAFAYLGHFYAYGYGVSVDYPKAMQLYKTSVDRGIAEGQNGLGLMFLHGLGVEMDRSKALQLFLKATDEGHPDGVYNAGTILESLNPARAIRHYEAAAATGHLKSMYRLAKMTERGTGTFASCSRALMYYKKTAEGGSSRQDLTSAMDKYVHRQDHTALLLYLQAAEEGYEVAQSNAVYLLELEIGTKNLWKRNQSQEIALLLSKDAALQGNSDSRVKIGDAFYYGKAGVEKNLEEAVIHYKIAAGNRNARAMFNLGYMYEYGIGTPKNIDQAKVYYHMSKKNDRQAVYPVLMAVGVMQLKEWLSSYFEILKAMCDRMHLSWLFRKTTSSKMDTIKENNRIVVLNFVALSSIQLIPSPTFTDQTFTIESWIYIDSEIGAKGYIASKDDAIGVRITQIDNGYRLESLYYPDTKGVVGTTVLQDNTWYHIAAVRHPSYHAVFVNGKMDGVRKVRGNLVHSNGDIHIGSYRGESDYFIGKMAETRIWSQVKTMNDLSFNMNKKIDATSAGLEMYMDLGKQEFKDNALSREGVEGYSDVQELSEHQRKLRIYGKVHLEDMFFPFRTIV